jgi:hypothetical protein
MFQLIFPLTPDFIQKFPKYLSLLFSACPTTFSIYEQFTTQKFLFSPMLLGTSKEHKQHSLLLLKPLGFQIAILHHTLAAHFLLHFFSHAHVALLPPLSHFSTVALVSPHPPSLFHCYPNVLVATSCSNNLFPLHALRTTLFPT